MEPETIVLLQMLASLTLYCVLGGADFGAGIWEFNTAFQAGEKERQLIHRAIGPVWEANHVWLIFLLVLTANGFPTAFAALSRALWLPLWLALVGIVFRGAAFAFRSHALGAPRHQQLWEIVFAVASTAAPFFLGASVGAVASGKLAVTSDGRFEADPLTGWLSPLPIFTAFFAVGMCAYLAAFYLTREAAQIGDHESIALWRQRSLTAGVWMQILAVTGLVLVAIESPQLWEGFRLRSWPLVVAALLCGVFSLWAIGRSKFTWAVFAAAATVATVLWAWGAAQYPALIPPTVTIESAKAPDTVLWAMVWGTGVGILIVAPSLGYLLMTFKAANPRHRGHTDSNTAQ